MQLKADRPYPRGYLHKPPDYRHTDKVYRLVMILFCSKLEGKGPFKKFNDSQKWKVVSKGDG